MSAPLKVSHVQVREAWERHQSLHGAADALRITRGALKKRLERLGIDPTEARTLAASATKTPAAAVPIRTLLPRPRVVRVEPANQARLWAAVRRLSEAFDVETDASLLLNQLIEEKLEAWVDEKEALAKPRRKSGPPPPVSGQ